MKDLLLIIDVQKNFVNENTKSIVLKIDELIKSNKFKFVAFTKFINDKNSNFYKELGYKGCMTEKDRQIVIDTKNYKVFEKNIYSAVNDEFKKFIKENDINMVYLCGIDTDACVLKTALDLFESNIKVKVLKDYSMSHSGIVHHKHAIEILKKLIGKNNVI